MAEFKKSNFILRTCLSSLILTLTGMGLTRVHAEEEEAHTGILKNWDIYGSVRLQGAYSKRDKWYQKLDSATAARIGRTPGSILVDTLPISQLQMGLQNNSYFGIRGKGETFGFGFEMGLGTVLQDVGLGGGESGGDITSLYLTSNKRQSTFLRKIYGDWFINDYLTLRIGQDWNIANFFISDQVYNSDAGLGYSGILYTGRRPQIKLTGTGKPNAPLTWKAEGALVKQDVYPIGSFALNAVVAKPEEKLPKFEFGAELGYKISDLAKAKVKVVGGFTQYDLVLYKEDVTDLKKDIRATVKSNLIGINANLDVWKISARLAYAQGQNLATYGVWMGNPDASLADAGMVMFMPNYTVTGDTTGLGSGYPNGNPSGTPPKDILNAQTRQGGLVINYQALSWLALEGGAGRVEADHDDPQVITNAKTVVNGLDRWAWYTNLQFSTAQGHFLIVPEFSYSDFGGFQKDKTNEGGGKLYSYSLKVELDI